MFQVESAFTNGEVGTFEALSEVLEKYEVRVFISDTLIKRYFLVGDEQ